MRVTLPQKKKGHSPHCKWPFSAPVTDLTLAYAPCWARRGDTQSPAGTIPLPHHLEVSALLLCRYRVLS
jgi:hypothetical protein